MSVLHPATEETQSAAPPVTTFGPDFPFAFDDWITHRSGLGVLPPERHGEEVAIIGGGIAGITAAYELMKLGFKPVLYESERLGGRLRSEPFEGDSGLIAELGGMRFPQSSVCFYHYLNLVGLKTGPFPNPLDAATPSTLIDLEGDQVYVEGDRNLPPVLREISEAWYGALEEHAQFSAAQHAIRTRDVATLKQIWNRLVPLWDERTFYDFVATSKAFQKHPFRHREIFGMVGFGTGGWDSDFPNSMLEILRVAYTNLDENQRFVVGGVEQLPRRLWAHAPEKIVHWPAGTSLSSLHQGSPRPAATKIARAPGTEDFTVSDRWGGQRSFKAVLVTCQSWLLTTHIACDEHLLSQKMWMALDRTRYMQSSKTFVMVDRPFWRDRDAKTGRYAMSMTLTDRISRGTYVFDEGEGRPASICLSYSWMGDALKVLPLSVDQRVDLMLRSLRQIYPDLDIASHIIGNPITVSWESNPNFLGAFKGALPGHYRYNHRMYAHFMQHDKPATERGIFLAGDGISWTPAWAEGAIQTALNAVWGILHHFGGATPADNPGPGDKFAELGPVRLPD
jgi:tryptophan 2-monooxygenase